VPGLVALAVAGAASAAPYRGGHHHAGVRWVTVQTRFLRIHVPAAGEPGDAVRTALAAAAVGDDLVLRLSDAAGWVPHGPIHLVVTDEADEMTAYTLPSWGWIVLSSDPGAVTMRLRGRQDWVPDALAHELGHLVGHRVAGALPPSASYGLTFAGVAEAGGLGFSAVVPIWHNVPYGWSEGAAEWWSDRIGVNRWSAGRAALIRTSALEDRLLDYDEWWVSADKGDVLDAERAYQQGYAFARWLQERTDRDVMRAMGQAAGRRYPLDWGRLLSRETGEPPRITWARWRAAAYAEAAAEAATIRAAGATEGVELEGWAGGWVAAAEDLDARDRWRRRGQRDREEAREATGSFDLFPRTSPDGRWTGVAQAGWVHVWQGSPDDLQAPDERTGARRARAARTSVWIPGPVGASFAFVPGRDAVVVVADVDATRGRLGRGAAPDEIGQLALVDLTPATELVRHRGGQVAVEVVDLSTGRARRTRIHPIPGTERARDPAVSPDGQRLAWLSSRDGTTNLVVAALDGAEPRALSAFDDGTWLQHPSWSPDGREIVVSMLRTDRPDLWRVDVATGAWRPLTADPQEQLDPVWAEDGIWFAADPGDVFDVFRLDPETGRVDRMTRELGGAHTPWPLPSGDLLYAAQTAHGFKAVRLAASERLVEPTSGFRPPPLPEVSAEDLAFRSPAPDVALRPYRPLRSLLVPGVGPILRVDGVPTRPTPLGGAFVRVRDAVERLEAQAYGLVGEDLLGEAEVTWRGLPPELAVWAGGSVDRGPGVATRQSGAGGVTASARLRSWAALALGPEGFVTGDAAGSRVRSVRAVATLQLGEAPARGRTGGVAALTATRAWSWRRAGLGGADAWHRLALSAAQTVKTPIRTGPLAEHRTRLELDGFLGATDRPVSLDERMYAGGDLPASLRLGVPMASVPLTGFAPYAVGGEALGVGQGTLVLPVLPRIRTRAGPLYLQGLAVAVGAGGAVAGPPKLIRDRQVTPLAQVTAELRWSALLLDAPWDGGVRFAWGIGAPDGAPWTPAGVALGGPRLVLSLGAAL
jgi:hypothetical protein